jgi:hypothetical protein
MYFQISLFMSLFLGYHSFLIPPQFLPTVTRLETIITSRAISSSFITNLRNEFSIEKIFTEITEFNYHSINLTFISLFITYMYGQYKYMEGSKIKKIEKFDKYRKINRITREILFIILFIFTKDVQNAI